jgi:hypothetical protein
MILGATKAMTLWMTPEAMLGAASVPPHSQNACGGRQQSVGQAPRRAALLERQPQAGASAQQPGRSRLWGEHAAAELQLQEQATWQRAAVHT